MKKYVNFFVGFLSLGQILLAQEDFVVNQSKFIQKANPSYFGLNNLNKVGMLYNSIKINENDKSVNQYAFVSLAFEEQYFSLGVDVNSLKIQNSDRTYNNVKLSFIYQVQLTSEWYFLPSVSLGFTNSSFNITNFIFEDQINVTTGLITASSDDPLSERLVNLDYLDLGTTMLIHNHELLFGLTLAHLNQPNISIDDHVTNKLPLKISLQAGYEINMNPHHENFYRIILFCFYIPVGPK